MNRLEAFIVYVQESILDSDAPGDGLGPSLPINIQADGEDSRHWRFYWGEHELPEDCKGKYGQTARVYRHTNAAVLVHKIERDLLWWIQEADEETQK